MDGGFLGRTARGWGISARIVPILLRPALPGLLLLIAGCDGAAPPSSVPGLGEGDAALIRALEAADDSLVVAQCYERGVHRVLAAAHRMRRTVDWSSQEAYLASRSRVRPHVERIFRVVADVFHCDRYLYEWSMELARPYPESVVLGNIQARVDSLFRNQGRIAVDVRLQAYRELLAELEGYDPGLYPRASVYQGIAGCLDEMGDVEGELEYRRRVLTVLLRGGLGNYTINQMGVVGYVHGKLGNADSLLHYGARARAAAYRTRLPRPLLFTLYKLLRPHYEDRGNLALAGDLTEEAQRALREFKGTDEELELVIEEMRRHADLGSWNVVEGYLVRGEALYAEVHDELDDALREIRGTDLAVMRARLLMARGEVDAGDAIFEEIRERVRNRPHREHYPRFLGYRGESLLAAGEAARAEAVFEEGLREAEAARLPGEVRRLAVAHAAAAMEAGDLEEAARSLAVFRREAGPADVSLREPWVTHDTIAIRLALARNDGDGASRAVAGALHRLHQVLPGIEATVEAYLFLDGCQPLRAAIHDYLGEDPRLGYGFEMFWRSLHRRLGGPGVEEPEPLPLQRAVGGVADRMAGRVAALDAVHCVYMVGKEAVIRWTASREGIERSTVSSDPRALERELTAVASRLSSESGDRLDRDALRALSGLASRLLPPLDDGTGPAGERDGDGGEGHGTGRNRGPVLITGDRFLNGFPFEALNLDRNPSGTGGGGRTAGDDPGSRDAGRRPGGPGYRPLLGIRDVAYLRYEGDVPVASPRARGLIVADPAIPRELRRRYPSLAPLPNTVAEAKDIQVLAPGSVLLMDDAATKQALVSRWEAAEFLVISAHFVRHPETPYLTFLPLASEPGRPDPGAAYLDLTDVRRADLGACGLVVLSGCATGAPYSDTAVWGPGLGDAFLDAGAGAVIRTFWPVKDSASRRLITAWAREWAAGKSPVAALNQVRRDALAESGPGLRFGWAAWAIEVGGL